MLILTLEEVFKWTDQKKLSLTGGKFLWLVSRLFVRQRTTEPFSQMQKGFVVVSGLPGSGKFTLARRLARTLELPVVDKDDILEALVQSRGAGDRDWRRQLSRDRDEIFMRQAAAFRGAILVSFWRLAGMSPTEGTPVEWLLALSAPLITIRCSWEPEVAAERFRQRMRHPGHLDGATPHAELMVRFRALACLEPLHVRLE